MVSSELPHDIDAEKATLGSVLLRPDAIHDIAGWMHGEYFYLERHKIIFDAMITCTKKRIPADVRLLSAELRANGQLDLIGGITYLSEITDSVPTSSRIVYYANIVKGTASLRKLIQVGGKIAAIGYEEKDVNTAVSKASRELLSVDQSSDTEGLEPIGNTIDSLYEDFNNGIIAGIPTGFRDLNELTGGYQKSDLFILAARPSVGKSSWSLCSAYEVAKRGDRVDIFSCEMSKKQNVQRLISLSTGIPLERFRDRKLTEDDMGRSMEAMGRINDMPLFIDDTSGIEVQLLRSRAMKNAMRYGSPGLIIIDYLQLVKDSSYKKDRLQEVSSVSRELKALARDLDCTVLALSQLSRAVEGRAVKVPMLSDLRESGQIEQDADIVAFIHRPELYDSESDQKGLAELHIAKHRNGALGVIPLRFDGVTTKFGDLSYRTMDGY